MMKGSWSSQQGFVNEKVFSRRRQRKGWVTQTGPAGRGIGTFMWIRGKSVKPKATKLVWGDVVEGKNAFRALRGHEFTNRRSHW